MRRAEATMEYLQFQMSDVLWTLRRIDKVQRRLGKGMDRMADEGPTNGGIRLEEAPVEGSGVAPQSTLTSYCQYM